MTDKLRDAAQKALARMEQDYDIACETEEGGEASEYCVGLLSDISALRAALTQQDAQAWQAAKWEAIRAVQHQYLGIVKAATNLLAEIDARHDNADAPLKYAVPYGAVTALREALTAKPLAQQDAQAVPLEPVYGDVLPPIGSRVFIRHGRDDDAHACTVTGYYAWPDLGGSKFVHRVFVRLVYEGTKIQQARLLRDCYQTAEAALNAAPTPPAQRVMLTDDEIEDLARGKSGHSDFARSVIEAYEKKSGLRL